MTALPTQITNGTSLASNQDVSRNSPPLVHDVHLDLESTASVDSCYDDVDQKSGPTVSALPLSYQEAVKKHESSPPAVPRPALITRHSTTSHGVAGAFTGPDIALNLNLSLSRTTTYLHRSRRPSVDSDKTLTDVESNMGPAASRVSTDAQGYTYPEGGLQAWLCVFGAFCGMMASLGQMNSIGTIQAYLHQNQLASYSESSVGWIFGIYAFLSFFCGIQVGPVFDAKGPRWLIVTGSVLVLMSWFLMGLCTQYWHFMVVFGILGGLGVSFILTPCIASIGHFFLRGRGLATGLAATGGSMGGVVFPLVLQSLFPKLGWAWSTRVIGFIDIILLVIANLCIRSRLPPRPATRDSILPDFKVFRDPVFALTTLGIFFVEWALFIPLTYLTSYSITHGIDPTFSYQVLAIFNAGSCFGRWAPGLLADKIGRFNTMIVTVTLCFISTLALWLPAGGSVPLVVVYAVIFGFASGTGISLAPVCIGQLCKVENYGRYYATSYCVVSLACLTGIPIAGTLVSASNGAYLGLILFTGASYLASMVTFTCARGLATKWTFMKRY